MNLQSIIQNLDDDDFKGMLQACNQHEAFELKIARLDKSLEIEVSLPGPDSEESEVNPVWELRQSNKAMLGNVATAAEKNPVSDNTSIGWRDVALGLLVIILIGCAVYFGYQQLDEVGWIEHDHETPVWIKGDWLAGEYRVCQIPLVPEQSLPDSAHLLCGQSEILVEEDLWSLDFIPGLSDLEFAELMGGRWSALDQHFHVLPVHYWGRINRSDRTMVSWRCQRSGESLTCRALN